MDRTKIANVLSTEPQNQDITIAGWVRTVRCSKGGFSFISMNDGSSLAQIQVVADKNLSNYDSEILHLTCKKVLRKIHQPLIVAW